MRMTVGKMPVLQAVIKVYCLDLGILDEYLAEMSSVEMMVEKMPVLQVVIKEYCLHLGSLYECFCRDIECGVDRSLDANLTIMGCIQLLLFCIQTIKRQ